MNLYIFSHIKNKIKQTIKQDLKVSDFQESGYILDTMYH